MIRRKTLVLLDGSGGQYVRDVSGCQVQVGYGEHYESPWLLVRDPAEHVLTWYPVWRVVQYEERGED